MERRFDAIQIVLGDGSQALDDLVQVDGHLGNLVVGEADPRVGRDIAHILFGHVLGHWTSFAFPLWNFRNERQKHSPYMIAKGARPQHRATRFRHRGFTGGSPRGRRQVRQRGLARRSLETRHVARLAASRSRLFLYRLDPPDNLPFKRFLPYLLQNLPKRRPEKTSCGRLNIQKQIQDRD